MALIPINQYKGQTKGHRTATAQEQRRFSAPLWQSNTEKQREYSNRKVQIDVLWEMYNNRTKSWAIVKFNEQPALYVWKFNTLKEAMNYIPYYMRKKGAESNYKRVVEKPDGTKKYVELDFRFVDNSDWYKNGLQKYSNDPRWFTKSIYTSQWIIKGKNFYRISFKQRISAEYIDDDYHNPTPNPWSHNDEIKWIDKSTGVKHKRSVRTYYGDDKPDTTYEHQQARKREKIAIQHKYDNYARHDMAMTEQEYNDYRKAERNTKMLKVLRVWDKFKFQNGEHAQKNYYVCAQNEHYRVTFITPESNFDRQKFNRGESPIIDSKRVEHVPNDLMVQFVERIDK